jgi:hypothetical protein
MESDEVKAAVRRGILILLANRFATALDFDFAGESGERFLRCVLVLVQIGRASCRERVSRSV